MQIVPRRGLKDWSGLVGQVTHHWARVVLDLVFPPRCVGCGKVGTWLCEACAQQMPLDDRPVCPRCGNAWSGAGICPRCRAHPLRVAPIRSAFVFEGVVRKAIHALKYLGGANVAVPLARRMAEAWRRYKFGSDVLVAVPLHRDRETDRGYNQSLLLARALSPQIGVPLAEAVLFRIRPTASQVHLTHEKRRVNVAGAFACPIGVDLSGLCVTLIDDVATTGATLDACAAALLAGGAKSVSAFTLAHAA